ncbi:MAG: DUF2752 domain-containing protein, partial [Treponema sp.]|nr:DUF2752 domain-containing protein [Treponema sp.]
MCAIRILFHVPCPTCGVTRALLSLLTGNVSGYCYYNIMAVPLLAATILMVAGTKRKNKKLVVISSLILLLNIPYYII